MIIKRRHDQFLLAVKPDLHRQVLLVHARMLHSGA